MSDDIAALIAEERLPADYAEVVSGYWAPLADELARRKPADRPLIVGINGAQGSGKTTLCRLLEALLVQRGLRAATLALDDFYLTKAERAEKAAEVHPLFATRGVPGTHDVALLETALDRLAEGESAAIPRFDKASDDRAPTAHDIAGPVDVILLEGWCVGAVPQGEAELAEPVNALERTEDAEGVWRRTVNRHLQEDYARLFGRIDLLVMLAVSGLEAVRANRHLQESKLAQSRPAGDAVMDEVALDRFIQHYERLTRHCLHEMPGRADVLFHIGADQRPRDLPDVLANPRPLA